MRDGGIVPVIVSHNFMDAINPKTREWIAQRANLIAAVRLPNTAFKGNAGTEVALLSLDRPAQNGNRISLADAIAVVNGITAKKGWNISIKVVPTHAALPDEVKASIKNNYGEKAKAKGVVHNGVAYVVAEGHISQADVEETILHEIKGHFGIHRLYGKDIKTKLNSLYFAIGGLKSYGNMALQNWRSMARLTCCIFSIRRTLAQQHIVESNQPSVNSDLKQEK